MNEADYKRQLVAEVNALRGGQARRIEDRFAVGILDLIIKLPGRAVRMAEGKLIKGNVFGPTERQWIEGLRWVAADVDVLLLGWKGNRMFVSAWVVQADCQDCLSGPNKPQTLTEFIDGPRSTLTKQADGSW